MNETRLKSLANDSMRRARSWSEYQEQISGNVAGEPLQKKQIFISGHRVDAGQFLDDRVVGANLAPLVVSEVQLLLRYEICELQGKAIVKISLGVRDEKTA